MGMRPGRPGVLPEDFIANNHLTLGSSLCQSPLIVVVALHGEQLLTVRFAVAPKRSVRRQNSDLVVLETALQDISLQTTATLSFLGREL